ncbi:MAG: LamG-like jellyroll fold domain-containing protein [Planctomycetota bacterium]|jgi:Tol biopolymer transport system component
MKTTRILAILVLALGLAAEVANADFVFGTPTNLGPPVNSSYSERGPDISADGLELYFFDYPNTHPGGYGDWDIWVATRATKDNEWGTPVNLGLTVNGPAKEAFPSISSDGLSLYFNSDRPGGYGGMDIWVTTRPTISDPWGEPVNLGPTVNSSNREAGPCISADGLSLFFYSGRSGGVGGQDIWVTTRESTDDDWGVPVNLGPIVNSSTQDYNPGISADGLWLVFSSERSGGYGGSDLWATTRDTIDDEWGTLVNLGPTVNDSANISSPDISTDGLSLCFGGGDGRPDGLGSGDIYQVPVVPVVDLNGDGIVDSADMCIMVDHWLTSEPLCDIGPMPWGDGIVDVQDLVVLAEHLFEEIFPLELVAYWKLDETEGDIAYDSVVVNDAVVFGGVVWQPEGGHVDGALQLDGIDDYLSTPFVLNPADGPFSVFAWIKGGAPGQVVISQIGGANWLLADPSEGKLRTSLLRSGEGRSAPQPLISEFIITDGAWHRVGFVSDASDRILYVDDVEVARDTQGGLGSSEGGLYIGVGSTFESSSFFSGLIDDVRIYNQAVTP